MLDATPRAADTGRAMSKDNVELCWRAYEASQRGERWDQFLDPEFEWDFSAYPGLDIPVQGTGRENFFRFLDRYRRAWLDYEAALKELIDAGDDVVAVVHETARARGTDISIEREVAGVWTWREARAIRVRGYRTREEALEAVGLREEARSQENVDADRTPWEGELRADDVMRRRLE
jgi:ketosteroid isomerase-like protein